MGLCRKDLSNLTRLANVEEPKSYKDLSRPLRLSVSNRTPPLPQSL